MGSADRGAKKELAALTRDKAEKFYRDAVRTAASLRETGRGSWRFLRTLRRATLARLGGVLAVVVAAAVVVGWLIPALARWSVTASVVATVGAAVPAPGHMAARPGQPGKKAR